MCVQPGMDAVTGKLLLVDFENVQPADLSRVGEDTRVIVFVGANQKSVPIDLVLSAQRHGRSIEWQQIDGNGSNALDFHIACHLGRVLERSPDIHCTVLSRDKGFDPLLRYLNGLGLRCRRINALPGAAATAAGTGSANAGAAVGKPGAAGATASKAGAVGASAVDTPSADAIYTRVLKILAKSEKKGRPRKRDSLSRHIRGMYQNRIDEPAAERVIARLLSEKRISLNDKSVVGYHF